MILVLALSLSPWPERNVNGMWSSSVCTYFGLVSARCYSTSSTRQKSVSQSVDRQAGSEQQLDLEDESIPREGKNQ